MTTTERLQKVQQMVMEQLAKNSSQWRKLKDNTFLSNCQKVNGFRKWIQILFTNYMLKYVQDKLDADKRNDK